MKSWGERLSLKVFISALRVAALFGVPLFLACALGHRPALAHEGHVKGGGESLDQDAPRPVSAEAAALIGLETAEIDFGGVEDVVTLTGFVAPDPTATRALSSRVPGVARAVHVQVGQQVRRGEALVTIDSPELARLEAELLGAQGISRLLDEELVRLRENGDALAANLLSRRLAEVLAQKADIRAKEILVARTKGISQEDFSAAGDVNSAPREEAGVYSLRSPLDGIVLSLAVGSGDGILEGESLLTVASLAAVQVIGEIPESLFGRFADASGKDVRIYGDSGADALAQGRVRFASPVVDPRKRTAHVVIDVLNESASLRDGMAVDAVIILRAETEAVVVPRSAVLKDGPVAFVFVQEEEGVFHRQEVALGASDDRVYEVLAGLVPGDVVVTRGAYSVNHVRAKPAPAANAEPAQEAK